MGTLAWVYRLVHNCLSLRREKRGKSGLTTNDFEDARIQVMKSAQAESFGEEYSSLTSDKTLPGGNKLLALKPRIDEDGFMRSGALLENAEYLPHDINYPIILP